MKRLKVILIIFAIINALPISAKTISVGIKFLSFSVHPKGAANAHLMPSKFDSKGIFVFNPGGSLNFEYFLWKDIFSLKAVQGLYGDCAMQFLGFSHAGVRVRLFKVKNFSMNLGLGPTFIYRQNWHNLPGYTDDTKFFRSQSKNWEYRFILYGGELEWNITAGKVDISFSVIPGGLDLINTSFGIRHIIDFK